MSHETNAVPLIAGVLKEKGLSEAVIGLEMGSNMHHGLGAETSTNFAERFQRPESSTQPAQSGTSGRSSLRRNWIGFAKHRQFPVRA